MGQTVTPTPDPDKSNWPRLNDGEGSTPVSSDAETDAATEGQSSWRAPTVCQGGSYYLPTTRDGGHHRPPSAGSIDEAIDTARKVGYLPGIGSQLTREE